MEIACGWLCYPAAGPKEERRNMQKFEAVVGLVEQARDVHNPYLLL